SRSFTHEDKNSPDKIRYNVLNEIRIELRSACFTVFQIRKRNMVLIIHFFEDECVRIITAFFDPGWPGDGTRVGGKHVFQVIVSNHWLQKGDITVVRAVYKSLGKLWRICIEFA